MAADMHIHIGEPPDLSYAIDGGGLLVAYIGDPARHSISVNYDYDKAEAQPNIWIGEVSWLKAGLVGDADTYIPPAVLRISELIPGAQHDFSVTITGDLIDLVIKALTLPNNTVYKIADAVDVRDFLDEHLGEKAYTISW